MIPRKRLHVLLYILRILYVSGDGDPGTDGSSILASTISSASEWELEENTILVDASLSERSILKNKPDDDAKLMAEEFKANNDLRKKGKESEEFFNALYDSKEEVPDKSSKTDIDSKDEYIIPTQSETTTETALPMLAVDQLSVNETLAESVTVQWTVLGGDHNTTVNISWIPANKPSDAWNSTELVAGSQNYTIPGLTPCTIYKICLSTISDEERTNCVEVETDTIKPGMPRDLKAVSTDNVMLKVTWLPPDVGESCVMSYKVQLDSQTHEQRHISKNFTNETSVLMTGLHSCTAYHVQVTPLDFKNASGDFANVISELTSTAESEPPRLRDEPDSIETKTTTTILKWRVPRENNNCTMINIITTCELKDVLGHGYEAHNRTAVESIQDQGDVRSNVTELSPFSIYECSAIIVNDKGNSSSSALVRVETKEGVPGEPANFKVNSYDPIMTLSWSDPPYLPCKLLNYEIVLSWKPAYPVAEGCIANRNAKLSVEPTVNKFSIEQYKFGKNTYLAYIKANGTAGMSTPSSITFNSTATVPDRVTNLTLRVDPSSEDPNVLDTVLSWGLPCNTGGTLTSFELKFVGWREGYDNHTSEVLVGDYAEKNISNNETFHYNFGELKPEYNYVYKVSAVINETDISGEVALFQAQYPGGIPPQPDEKYTENLAIPPNKAQRTTTTSTVLLPLFPDVNGTIMYYAIMVAVLNYNNASYARFDLQRDFWPNVSSWEESAAEDFKKPYQATPQRWNVPLDKIVTYGKMKFVKWVLGEDSICKDLATSDNRKYCNGPLKPNTYYHVRMRAYTNGGYADSIKFTIKTNAELNVVLVTSIVSGILFLGILTTLMLLVRKYSPRLLLQRVLQADITGSPVPSPFTRRKFLSHCQQLADNPGKLSNEFQLLQTLSVDLQMPTNAACLQANRKKNRYSDILPYDFSRVKLDIIDNDPNTDYINASFIRGYTGEEEYIACQGPKEETTYDFWRMIDQYNVSIILMLTQLVEKGKEKCHQYYPTIRETFNYEKMSIRCTSELHYRTFTQRTLVLQKDEKKRNIVHMHYRDWPDHDVPEDFEAMINFCQIIRKQIVELKGLVVIHCSAGIGRTGTLIATDILLQHIRDNRKLDVFGTVYRLRRHRLNMVQRESQYAFIYNCVRQVLKNPYFLKTYKPPPIDTVYSNHLKKKKDRSDSNSDISGSIDTLNRKNSLSISMDSLKPLCESSPRPVSKSGMNVLLSGLRFSKSTSAIDAKTNHNRFGRFNSEGYMLCDSAKDSCSTTSKETAEDFRDSSNSLYDHISEPLLQSSSANTLNYDSSCLSNGSVKDTSL